MRPRFGILFALIGGAVGAYFGQPLAHANSDVVTVLMTVMTVFAGFLVAILVALGNPAMIPGQAWQSIELRRDSVEPSLIRHQVLFVFYLIAIGLLFVGILLNQATPASTPVEVKTWVERLYLFFGIFSFILTFGLPWTLLQIPQERLDIEMEKRRRESAIVNDGTESHG